MVSVAEPLVLESRDKLTSVESELVSLTLQQFDECVAPTLTPSCREMNVLLNAVRSRRHIASNDSSLASAAIAQVSGVFHTFYVLVNITRQQCNVNILTNFGLVCGRFFSTSACNALLR